MAPPKPLNQRGGGPALKPIKSDSWPQRYTKTTSRLDRPGQLALRFKRACRPAWLMDAPLALTRPKRAAASVALPDPSPDVAAKRRCEPPNARARPADRSARRTLRRQGQGARASASQQVCTAGWHEPQRSAAHLRRRLAWSRSQATRSSAPRGALLLSRPVVVNNLLSHTPQLR